MKGTRAISFLLVLALMASLVVPGFFAQPARAEGTDNGMRISKTATKNDDDGSYTITLEAYATGSKVISEVKTDIPADIVLVLDQSGSMDNDMHTYSFREYTNKTNSDYYELRHNGGDENLYYQMKDDGYAAVSVQRTRALSYDPIENQNNLYYYNNRNNLYVIYEGEYHKVDVERSGNVGSGKYTYTFTPNGGRKITILSNDIWYNIPDFGTYGSLYLASASDYSYTYTYTDENGVTQEIGKSDGANTTPTEFTLYERYSTGTTTRREALKSAVNTFANSVAAKAKGKDGVLGTNDDVKHRVAVVGFASKSGYDNNTELLSIAGSNSGSVGVAYNNISNQNLKDVLQDMTTTGGQQMVQSAIGALAAEGATRADLGMDMADRILNANPVPNGEKRTRVVVFFTDGSPTSSNGFETSVANDAISKAGTIKAGGASVYSVGIFEGADATSAGSSTGSSPDRENWFMQSVSSNNGKVQSPSYYLSAADAGTLSSIFQQIASNIESGGTTATLDSSSVVKDIIAPSFQLPEGATADSITLETYKYTGVDNWVKNADAMGAEASIEGDQVSVTGFNFTENWCGTVTENGSTTYRGNKLVISFKVVPKDGFLGGNDVPTNGDASGVYADASDDTPIMYFDVPKVNVPIGDVSVTSTDKNVYLLGGVPAETLKSGTTVTVGGVPLKLGEENYGLADWQTEYVDIGVVIKDKNDTDISATGLTGLTDDNSYTVSVTVSPKGTTDGAKSGTGTGNIYVYKPVLTYKDSSVYYGDSVPTDFSGNLASASWQHNGAAADATTMGAAPALSFQYTPGTGVVNDTIATKQDIPVDVTVSIVSIDGKTDITEYTTFPHINCEGKTCDVPSGSEFLLHVKTCTLTITKISGDSSEPYVFSVKKGDDKYTEASITGNGSVTIYELPVGTYSIQEDTGWSWRYTPSYSDSVTLSATNPNGTITCTNTKTGDFWLNGFSAVVKNIFGIAG